MRNLIKTLQATMPRGEQFDLAQLKALGISAVLAYVDHAELPGPKVDILEEGAMNGLTE